MTYQSNGSATTEWETLESQYANPEASGEWEDEWESPESHESHYSNPESEDEWESTEASGEWETHESNYSNPEWESHETAYANEWEGEWETHESNYSNPEWEDEGEFFFKKAFRALKKVALPLAKRLAPFAARALVGMIPGVGAVAGPLAGKLVGALVREGEMEAMQAEASFFGSNEMEAEIGTSAEAHEAALMEVLASEASHAESVAEAAALAGAAVPMAMRTMRAGTVRSVFPTLVRANTRLVRFLHSRGPNGQQLLPMTATIMRRTVASLRAARRRGVDLTPALAVRVMAGHVQRVMGVQAAQVLTRNAAVRRAAAGPAR